VTDIDHLSPAEKFRYVVRRLIMVRRLLGNISGKELGDKMVKLSEK
jgi:hypothetical protein